MAGQCHRSDQHEFHPTPGGNGRQEGLACSGPWGHEKSDTTKRLNSNNKLSCIDLNGPTWGRTSVGFSILFAPAGYPL